MEEISYPHWSKGNYNEGCPWTDVPEVSRRHRECTLIR
jgi:hypothetical protein